jgi:hypothetical protein
MFATLNFDNIIYNRSRVLLLSSLYERKTETHIRQAHFLGCEL